MEAANMHNKLILAVVQEDDYDATVSELNQNGFFVTMLSSTGGFWKKKNITIMLGVEESRLPQAMDILKRCAGKRKQTIDSLPSGGAARLRNFLFPRAFSFFHRLRKILQGNFEKSVGNQHLLCYNKHIVIFIISSKL